MSKPNSQPGIQSSTLSDKLPNNPGTNAVAEKSIAPLKISLSQTTTLRWSMAEEVFQLRQTGFDAIGMWRPKLADIGEHKAVELLRDSRLSVSSLSFAGGFTGGCGFSYVDAIADGRQAIDQAEAIGAKTVVVVGGPRGSHTINHSRKLVVDGLKSLADFAELAGVTLSLLPMHPFFSKRWTFVNSLDQTLDVLSRVDRSIVGMAFDTYHLWEEPGLLERIPVIAPLTHVVQIGDCRQSPQCEQDRLIPGQGILPLTQIVQAFQSGGFAGFFDVQVWSGNVWRSNYIHSIEQAHAAVKSMSLRVPVTK